MSDGADRMRDLPHGAETTRQAGPDPTNEGTSMNDVLAARLEAVARLLRGASFTVSWLSIDATADAPDQPPTIHTLEMDGSSAAEVLGNLVAFTEDLVHLDEIEADADDQRVTIYATGGTVQDQTVRASAIILRPYAGPLADALGISSIQTGDGRPPVRHDLTVRQLRALAADGAMQPTQSADNPNPPVQTTIPAPADPPAAVPTEDPSSTGSTATPSPTTDTPAAPPSTPPSSPPEPSSPPSDPGPAPDTGAASVDDGSVTVRSDPDPTTSTTTDPDASDAGQPPVATAPPETGQIPVETQDPSPAGADPSPSTATTPESSAPTQDAPAAAPVVSGPTSDADEIAALEARLAQLRAGGTGTAADDAREGGRHEAPDASIPTQAETTTAAPDPGAEANVPVGVPVGTASAADPVPDGGQNVATGQGGGSVDGSPDTGDGSASATAGAQVADAPASSGGSSDSPSDGF